MSSGVMSEFSVCEAVKRTFRNKQGDFNVNEVVTNTKTWMYVGVVQYSVITVDVHNV